MPQATAVILSSPAAGTVLADTGAMLAAAFTFTVIVSTQYAARITLALRDTTNASDVWSQLIHTASDHPATVLPLGSVSVSINQRLVVRAESDMLGEVQASILW